MKNHTSRYLQGSYPIVAKENLAKDIFMFEIHCPEVVEKAQPGQFVHIAIPGHALRRPISISEINREKKTIRIVFAVKGSGTQDLSGIGPGSVIDIIGPLGHGFKPLEGESYEAANVNTAEVNASEDATDSSIPEIILVGGGIGVPPMVGLSQHYGKRAVAISGFRDQAAVILQDRFEKNGTKQIVCTDDGSYGIHGLVTVPLEDLLKEASEKGTKPKLVAACGPMPMLRAIAAVAEKYDVPCQVSLEQHMGCGIGACLVCTCKIKTKDGLEYKHVCKDGPVFDSQEVEF